MHRRLCIRCYAKAIGEVESRYSERLASMAKLIKDRYLAETTVTAEKEDEGIAYHIDGPDSLIPHGGFVKSYCSVPKSLASQENNSLKLLTRREISRYRVLDSDVSEVLGDIMRQNWYANKWGVNYLTHRELDLDVIRRYEEPAGRRHRIAPIAPLSPTMLAHSVPVIETVGLKDIIKLRKKEGAAFELYRDAVSKTLKQHPHSTLIEQQDLFNDVRRPEIAKINSVVRNSRKLLIQSIMQDVVVASGAIGIGFFSGLLPPMIGAAAVGLGSIHYSPKFVRKLTELCAEPPRAMESRYYFLWKVSKVGGESIDAI